MKFIKRILFQFVTIAITLGVLLWFYLYYQKKHYTHRNDNSIQNHLLLLFFNLNELEISSDQDFDLTKISIKGIVDNSEINLCENGKLTNKKFDSQKGEICFRVYYNEQLWGRIFQYRTQNYHSGVYQFYFKKEGDMNVLLFKIVGPDDKFHDEIYDKNFIIKNK